MASLKKGDKLIVDSLSRFARNTKDLLGLVEQLNSKGIIFISLKEAIDTTTTTTTTTPTGVFMLTVFGAVSCCFNFLTSYDSSLIFLFFARRRLSLLLSVIS